MFTAIKAIYNIIIFLILFVNIALSQNKRIKVEIPSQNLNSFVEYDENIS